MKRVKCDFEINCKEVRVSNLHTDENDNSSYNLGIGAMLYVKNQERINSVLMYRGMDFYRIAKLGCLDGGMFGVLESDLINVPASEILKQAHQEGLGEALMVYTNPSEGKELVMPEYESDSKQNKVIKDIVKKEYTKLRGKDLIPKTQSERKVSLKEYGHPNMFELYADGKKIADNVLFTNEESNKTLELMFPLLIETDFIIGENLHFYDGEGYNRAFVILNNATGKFDIYNKEYGLLKGEFAEKDLPGEKVYSNLSAKEVNDLFVKNKIYFMQANKKKDWIGKVDGLTEVLNSKGKTRIDFDAKYRGFPENKEIETYSEKLKKERIML